MVTVRQPGDRADSEISRIAAGRAVRGNGPDAGGFSDFQNPSTARMPGGED